MAAGIRLGCPISRPLFALLVDPCVTEMLASAALRSARACLLAGDLAVLLICLPSSFVLCCACWQCRASLRDQLGATVRVHLGPVATD